MQIQRISIDVCERQSWKRNKYGVQQPYGSKDIGDGRASKASGTRGGSQGEGHLSVGILCVVT